jgi:Spy/CpxP family protein refolding chaperone
VTFVYNVTVPLNPHLGEVRMFSFRGVVLSVVLVSAMATAGLFPVAAYSKDSSSQAKQEKLWQELDLTPQQRGKISAIYRKTAAKMRSHQQALSNAQKELASMQSSNAQTDKTSSKQSEINDIKQKIAELRKQYTASVKEILTAEQWAKLQKMKRERQESRNEV